MLLSILLASQAHAWSPVKGTSCGLGKLIDAVSASGVAGIGSFADLFHARRNALSRVTSWVEYRQPDFTCRYIYSRKWGWIDLQHFAAAAWTRSLVPMSGTRILLRGEENERQQERDKENSRWDYEDLMSNFLGVDFAEHLSGLGWSSPLGFVPRLHVYLERLGFEYDVEHAPNFRSLLNSEAEDDVRENHRYIPWYAPDFDERLFNDWDREAYARLQAYLKSQGRRFDSAVK